MTAWILAVDTGDICVVCGVKARCVLCRVWAGFRLEAMWVEILWEMVRESQAEGPDGIDFSKVFDMHDMGKFFEKPPTL